MTLFAFTLSDIKMRFRWSDLDSTKYKYKNYLQDAFSQTNAKVIRGTVGHIFFCALMHPQQGGVLTVRLRLRQVYGSKADVDIAIIFYL